MASTQDGLRTTFLNRESAAPCVSLKSLTLKNPRNPSAPFVAVVPVSIMQSITRFVLNAVRNAM